MNSNKAIAAFVSSLVGYIGLLNVPQIVLDLLQGSVGQAVLLSVFTAGVTYLTPNKPKVIP
jgi:hypothetical protein